MREAVNYNIVVISEKDYFVTSKRYNKVTDKFSIGNVTYIDNGYYLVEITPLKENYNMRFYFDDNKKFIDYYIDITLENGVMKKIPYYIDLYLDIVHYPKNNKVCFIDEDELEEAFNNNYISRADYELAYRVGNRLLKEIKEDKNEYLKIDVLEYINRFF
jgi:predicted RNA-binding protein associated with RNAse of E/G family